jgi:RNA polymerase sigma-70 factor (ECF subfamily)
MKTNNENLIFNEIYKKYHNDILNLIKFKINNKIEIAEELTNDVFVKVSKHLNSFDPEKSQLRTWLFTIANNTVIDYYRTNKNKDNTITAIESFKGLDIVNTHQSDNVMSVINGEEINKNINIAINRLSGIYKIIAKQYFLNEYSYEEISEQNEIPIGTVKAYIHRVREILKENLTSINIHALVEN